MRPASLLSLLLIVVAGCGDSTKPDSGGSWTATLAGPAGTLDGAAVVELRGSGIQSVSALDGQLFTHTDNDVVRVVVVRETPGEIRFRVQLAAGSDLPRPSVIEVADGDDALRTSIAAYNLKFTR